MTSEPLEAAIEDAARLVAGASHLVAFVGAGLSAESGVPTFRGPEGLWTKMGEPDMRGYDRFLADPKKWWEERSQRAGDMKEFVDALDEAVPNDGHYALRELEEAGFLKHIITQNIDNLHQVAGSQAITEIHGNRTKLRCIECSRRWDIYHFDIEGSPPSCPDCGGIIKGDTVMFGEPIPHDALEECAAQSQMCDCMLLIGTSAVVYPAASFPEQVKSAGGTLIEVNPNETPLSAHSDVILRGAAGEVLPKVTQQAKGIVQE
ncbi:MAG: NAD-dependent deacylase [Chloroflexi bacterium]|nr:NAD-dependent deacylase [Chloroflexota bacterium]